ncbi:cytochrome-c peroxidase [Magnetospirillum sp. UT-4]|uniref:cytochrome-c peroxidase n=1 Tax=Magnetospirillum sp. UT-4 TaxID=2681467 RepID=UPI0013805D38|nr:cytochrome-c peroxidase [Magnetospirillum sp. UT-4]CAA7626981.1 Cytochrome C peroxidase (Cpp-like) [Magnetospirillum sp. UT-4]
MTQVLARLAAVGMVVVLGFAQPVAAGAEGSAEGSKRSGPAVVRLREPIRPLTPIGGLDPAKVDLGRRLFHDPILSRDGTIACATCHDLGRAGMDGRPVSAGIGGALGVRNAPTVYNAALNLAQFWDGRAATLQHQAAGPVTNPVEMGAQWPEVLARLEASVHAEDLHALYGRPVTMEAVLDSIAVFEKTLVTTGSRFDRWLLGDEAALTNAEKRGYALFKSYGCAACHQGANVGGNLYQRFGFFGDWFAERGRPLTDSDFGRFKVTGRDRDRFVFKVPSLRLAALTAPYFHDGSVATLEEAIRLMARHQLGRDMPESDIRLVAAFLASLVDPERLPP